MDYLIHLAIYFTIYSILGLSLNLITGYTGLFSIAHAVFYGIGAYTTAILLTRFEANFFFSLIFGVILASIISFLLGIVLSRFNEDYFAIVALAFSVIAYAVFLNWKELTRGYFGIPGIGKPYLLNFEFSSTLSFLILTTIALVIIFLICRFIVNSSFGRVLKTIREDEKAIQIFGYNTDYYKLLIFVIGSAMAAFAGSFFASYLTFISPSVVSVKESIFVVTIIIIGGLGSLYGPFLGALFIIFFPEVLRFVGMPDNIAAQMRQIIYGAILVLLMLYRPQGLIGKYKL